MRPAYRINYGNGQVSEEYRSLAQAFKALARERQLTPSEGGYFFVQFRDSDTGDWFKARELRRRNTALRK